MSAAFDGVILMISDESTKTTVWSVSVDSIYEGKSTKSTESTGIRKPRENSVPRRSIRSDFLVSRFVDSVDLPRFCSLFQTVSPRGQED